MALIPHMILAAALLTGLACPGHGNPIAVGETWKIRPPIQLPAPLTEVEWRFQGNVVVSHQGGIDAFGTGYSGRVRVDATTGALELRKLTLEDNGKYTVTMKTGDGSQNTWEGTLAVLIPISVEIQASATEVLEFQTVTVNCTVSGSRIKGKLTGNGGPLTSESGSLKGSVVITTHPTARRDMETFVCEGSNDLGATFTNLDIKVHYGPDDDTAVMATPKGPSYRTGSDVVLRCSSVSSPAAQIQWARNGTLMGREEPELKLENVQPSQSGGYTCWAKNTKTGKNVQSKPLYIRVSQTGLSDGDIAGIVIGSVLAVVALIAILLLVLGFRCQPSKGFYRNTSTETDSP